MLILDATCGGRHLWVDKDHPNTVYVDRRICAPGAIPIRPNWEVRPDIVADFTDLPFADRTFDMVVWDPPHIIRAKPSKSFLRTKYGELAPDTWEETLRRGFAECWRVLRAPGTLHFKWADGDRALREVLALFPIKPLFKNKARVSWSVFAKCEECLTEVYGPVEKPEPRCPDTKELPL